MQIDMVHRFQALDTHCHDMCLVAGEQAQLGIIYKSAPLAAPHERGMYLALIDITQQRCASLVVYSEMGPELRGGADPVSDVCLRYDVAHTRWVIAQFHNGFFITLRTLTIEPSGTLVLSPLCLLDREADFEHGFNPLLDLQITETSYRVLTHKAVSGHLSAPQVCALEVTLRERAWHALQEPAVLVVSGTDPLPVAPRDRAVVLPEETYFDPGLSNVSWNAAARLVANTELATAENAMVFSASQMQILVLATPEEWISVKEWNPGRVPGREQRWRTWITGWDARWSTVHWRHPSHISLPAETLPSHEYPLWPDITVAVTNGPAQQGETVVVVVSMRDEQDTHLSSEGVCLKQDTGEVLQTCASPLGFTPSLCCCGELVVGVDQFNGQWRVWNWPALHQATIVQNKLLSSTCQSAYVYSMPEDEGQFWLIEDRDEGLALSRYDAHTFAEHVPAAFLPDMHLLYTQYGERALNWHHRPGLLAYRDTFFLLLRDANKEIILYQVR